MTKDWVQGVGHSQVCQILLQIVLMAVITSSPPTLTSSARMLSTPADFPFFSDCTAASTFFVKDGVVIICVCLGTVQYWWISIGLVIVQLSAVTCPSVELFHKMLMVTCKEQSAVRHDLILPNCYMLSLSNLSLLSGVQGHVPVYWGALHQSFWVYVGTCFDNGYRIWQAYL